MSAGASLIDAFATQVRWCRQLKAPFTARVIEMLADDWQAAGPTYSAVPRWDGNAWDDAVPLRLAGALHALALQGRDEALAAAYARPDEALAHDFELRRAVVGALRRWPDDVAEALRRAPQTNEVGRSGVLLGGFGFIARHTALPLALHEIGASAGLNLLWDRFCYRLGESLAWGDAASPVLVECDWSGRPPVLPPAIAVQQRRGCDVAPIDAADAEAALRLQSYVWADHRARLLRLRAALALAREHPPAVDCGEALPWLAAQLNDAPREGVTTVVVHSLVWQYLGDAQRQGIRALLDSVGERATPRAPLAWLRMEPYPNGSTELKLTLWPGGVRRLLAQCQPHGATASWH